MPQKARVLYAFTAENPEEMSLGEGELITVTNMVCYVKRVARKHGQLNFSSLLLFSRLEYVHLAQKNNDGWWEGEIDGRRGLFPETYVEVCTKHTVPQTRPAKEIAQ
jgi:hypothetical protein